MSFRLSAKKATNGIIVDAADHNFVFKTPDELAEFIRKVFTEEDPFMYVYDLADAAGIKGESKSKADEMERIETPHRRGRLIEPPAPAPVPNVGFYQAAGSGGYDPNGWAAFEAPAPISGSVSSRSTTTTQPAAYVTRSVTAGTAITQESVGTLTEGF